MKRVKLGILLSSTLALASSSASAALITFTGSFSGSQSAPPVTSPATGTATLIFNDQTREFSLNFNVHGLSTPAVALHLDSPTPGPGGVIEDYLGNSTILNCGADLCRSISFGDGFFIPANNVSALLAGQDYLAVYTTRFPVGPNTSPESMGPEVAAQLQAIPEPVTAGLMSAAIAVLALARRRMGQRS